MYNIVSPNESIIKQIYYFAKHGINNVEQNNMEMLFREIEKNDISKIKVSISELAEQAMDLAGDNSTEEVSPDLGLE